MAIYIVVNNPASWPFHTPGIGIVSARKYLTDPAFLEEQGAKVFNLCRSHSYQSLGYYVSLLAAARGHGCIPTVATIQDLKSASIVRVISDDLDELVQKSLRRLASDRFEMSIYFGRNLAHQYDRLAARIFSLFPAPLLRAHFVRKKKWRIQSIGLLSGSEVPESHRSFVAEVASEYFSRRRLVSRRSGSTRYDLAILHDPAEEEPPSNEPALSRFVHIGRSLGISVELIGKEDYGRLAEFDGLFIRETTRVDHHTYRFSRRAQEEGLVVIDDPESILRCTNKVYLAELLSRHRITTPRTVIVHEENAADLEQILGLPIILKQPDSAASQGVVKVETPEALASTIEEFLDRSDLVIAQEFTPTAYDWRVGVIDGRPLYVCKYHMAADHWQIIDWSRTGARRYGAAETLAVEVAPPKVVRLALRAARLVGDGLYGVDVKEVHGRSLVIEVNDNPTIETGCEDRILGDQLYREILGVFTRRIDERRARGRRR